MVGKVIDIWISQKSKIALFQGVPDFDLHPQPGAGKLESRIMMLMPTFHGNYGPNMNDFW